MRSPELWGCVTEDTTVPFSKSHSPVLKEREALDFPPPMYGHLQHPTSPSS